MTCVVGRLPTEKLHAREHGDGGTHAGAAVVVVVVIVVVFCCCCGCLLLFLIKCDKQKKN